MSFEPAFLLHPEKGDVLHWKDKPSATVIKVVENGGVKLRYSNFKTQTVSMPPVVRMLLPITRGLKTHASATACDTHELVAQTQSAAITPARSLQQYGEPERLRLLVQVYF